MSVLTINRAVCNGGTYKFCSLVVLPMSCLVVFAEFLAVTIVNDVLLPLELSQSLSRFPSVCFLSYLSVLSLHLVEWTTAARAD